jgi:hypothetical protein
VVPLAAEIRKRQAEQLGVEPSAETRGLYDGLLKGAKIPQRTSAAQPTGTITFLFTDIEGSTRLLDKLGDQYAVALGEHHEIMRAAIQKWNGHEVDTQGDAFFVTFTRASDAIQCAAEAQRTLSTHQWAHGKPLRVRMGLHTGEPLISSTGYVGMDVHRAARIGDGWMSSLSNDPNELVQLTRKIDSLREEMGTADRPFHHWIKLTTIDPVEIERLQRLGLSRFQLLGDHIWGARDTSFKVRSENMKKLSTALGLDRA